MKNRRVSSLIARALSGTRQPGAARLSLVVSLALLGGGLPPEGPGSTPAGAMPGPSAAAPAAIASANAASYYTVTPCRLINTRTANGPYGGPPISGGAATARTFVFAGRCKTSPTAGAISLNLTVTAPAAAGFVTLYPGGSPLPNTSTINYRAGQTRANNAIIATGVGGDVVVYCGQPAGTTVQVIIDVNGYFDDPANNQPPTANAGPDQTISLPNSASLNGSGTDDGLPNPPAALTYSWSKISGPGTVAFGGATLAATTATFSLAGTYILRLTVSDSVLTDFDDITVNVNPATAANPTADAVRFLEQSTWGPTDALIAHVQDVGCIGFLNEQFATSSSGNVFLPLWPNNVPTTCDSTCFRDNYTMYPLQRRLFTNALYAPDQLRQRVAFALHKLLVVSGLDISMSSRLNPYLQILDRNAFGNFRQLLYEITLNPAMGQYLNMNTNTKTNPNENYAREILQLFTIGTDLLNADGTPQYDVSGIPYPTYDQSVVTNLAKVFTGWRLSPDLPYPPDPTNSIDDYVTPMVFSATRHDTSQKTILNGQIINAGQTGDQDLNQALDIIFNHSNLGPYLAKQLIHQLVTSNPSPAYVGRVAAIFNDNGSGVRGDMKSVISAILLDPEARGDLKTDPAYGHFKEPALLVANLLRAFDAKGDGLPESDGYLNPQASSMGQDVYRPPTVFSYFPADFEAPGSGLLGPEFGILSATTALKRANFVNTMVYSKITKSANATTGNAPDGTTLDFTRMLPFAAGPAGPLIDELNRVMLHGSMSTYANSGPNNMWDSIYQAVTAIPCPIPCSGTAALQRVQQAVYLVATSSQYQVQR
jgi:uncharacterized protein (DUF1800 family)